MTGAKFGGYGSFLPTQECSPSNCSHAKTPQSDSNKPLSECNLSMEVYAKLFFDFLTFARKQVYTAGSLQLGDCSLL